MSYSPPCGLVEFVRVLQGVSPDVATDLLQRAFDNATSEAVLEAMQRVAKYEPNPEARLRLIAVVGDEPR
jgi:hypothetical protein